MRASTPANGDRVTQHDQGLRLRGSGAREPGRADQREHGQEANDDGAMPGHDRLLQRKLVCCDRRDGLHSRSWERSHALERSHNVRGKHAHDILGALSQASFALRWSSCLGKSVETSPHRSWADVLPWRTASAGEPWSGSDVSPPTFPRQRCRWIESWRRTATVAGLLSGRADLSMRSPAAADGPEVDDVRDAACHSTCMDVCPGSSASRPVHSRSR
jgi:hypothetical protein